MEFIVQNKTVALKGSDEQVQNFLGSLATTDYVIQRHPTSRVLFSFECVAKVDIKGGSFYVFYLNLSEGVTHFDDLKFFIMPSNEEEVPTMVFELGAVIEWITAESGFVYRWLS